VVVLASVTVSPGLALKVIGLPLVPECAGENPGTLHPLELGTLYVPAKKSTVSPAAAFARAVDAAQGVLDTVQLDHDAEPFCET